MWGAATAAYQIEGAHREDDRGVSIWDTFSHQPGKIRDGDTGDVAVDHYHRWREDVELMASLGLQSYRFSLSWSRILPFGTGAVNEKGLRFYDNLIDALLDRSIEPMITLYHWDLPQALQDLGGWANREIVDWFAEYARLVFRQYGDRVKKWCTLNEPWVWTIFGHRTGTMAPGIRSAAITARAIHHGMLAHGRAVQVFREAGNGGQIGLTNADTWFEPADDSPEATGAVESALDFETRLYHDPVYGRGYPDRVLAYYSAREAPFPIEPGDMDVIAAPTDFMGVQLYTRRVVAPGSDGGMGFQGVAPTLPLLGMGYEQAPHSLGDFVRWVTKEYDRPKLYITENGVNDDTEIANGVIDDKLRVDLLRGFLAGLHGAIQDGADVRGYYQWSLLDNFEWAHGFSRRFGMVYTDYETLARVPKKSAAWYSQVMRENAIEV
ncbi:MAG: GH1 family beta-glucosidase [Candidatus Eiseniibacteriota bacterium]